MTSAWILVAPAVGVVGAGALVTAVRGKVEGINSKSTVDGGAAWSPYDSWLTNLGTLFAAIGAVWGTLTGQGSLVSADVIPAVTVIFVVCGASAALAPVLYAALASQQATKSGEAIGTVAGLLLSAGATLFAIFGELAALSVVVWQVSSTAWARVSQGLVQLLIVAAVGFICAYSSRTLYAVLSDASATAKTAAAKPADQLAAEATGRPLSYLNMNAGASTFRRSATL